MSLKLRMALRKEKNCNGGAKESTPPWKRGAERQTCPSDVPGTATNLGSAPRKVPPPLGRVWSRREGGDNGFAFGKVECEMFSGDLCGYSKGKLGNGAPLGTGGLS